MVHGNTEHLQNHLKYFFLKKWSKRNIINFLVFSDEFRKLFHQKEIYNVIVSPHGFPQAIEVDKNKLISDFNELLSNLNFYFTN